MKRLYEHASVVEDGGAFQVALDGRPLRTPARRELRLPTRELTEAIALEWRAQGETVRPASMPLTRLAATAVDRVAPQRRRVVDEIAAYGATDLLCYRAASPPELAARQEAVWQPLLERAARRFGARLAVTCALAPAPQEPAALSALRAAVEERDDMALTALHAATAATGSVVLGLLLAAGEIEAEAAWDAAQLDESFQAERWGEDEEAAASRRARRRDLIAAARFMRLCAP